MAGGDHDYTRPRTPPSAPAVKQKVKKPAAARPALPAKPVKWKPREYADKFQIIYKFLTNGVDAEDIMYIKNAYEMVRNEVGFYSLNNVVVVVVDAKRRIVPAKSGLD